MICRFFLKLLLGFKVSVTSGAEYQVMTDSSDARRRASHLNVI